ncbi:MAG: tripartite tricarboxylate transporter substrate binding protein [Betaproteobacteria bacterium]|nr:tripartite tricarboxylate transporter substrate binding protein [Betaproteobacteria bacterium]
MKTLRFGILLSAISILAAAGVGVADTYPSKPIRWIIPFSPGGGTELMARAIGQKLHETWAQPVVIDSRTHAISPNLFREPPYHPVRDFEAITLVGTAPEMLVAHPSVQVNSVKELLALAKSEPGKLNYASPGTGSIGHMTMELFKKVTGANIVHIPYKGSGAAVRETVGGQVQLMFSAPGAVIGHIRVGRLKALAVGSPRRTPGLDDIPTFTELGYPEVVAANWYGVLTTAGTPAAVINQINREIVRIVRLPEIKEMFFKRGYETMSATPEEAAKYVKDEFAKWGEVVKVSGVRLD